MPGSSAWTRSCQPEASCDSVATTSIRVDAVETREQVEVRRPEAARLDRPIGHADDEPPVGRGTRVLEAEVAETVLVDGAAREHAAFVGPEGGHEEQRLAEHPLRAAVERRSILQLLDEQALEVADALLLTAELIVELEHLAHERRAQLEGRTEPLGDRLVRGGEEDGLAVVRRQPLDRDRQAQAQGVVELRPGDEIGQDERGAGIREERVLDRAPEERRGAIASAR